MEVSAEEAEEAEEAEGDSVEEAEEVSDVGRGQLTPNLRPGEEDAVVEAVEVVVVEAVEDVEVLKLEHEVRIQNMIKLYPK